MVSGIPLLLWCDCLAIWRRNAYLITFLIACLVVLWVRRMWSPIRPSLLTWRLLRRFTQGLSECVPCIFALLSGMFSRDPTARHGVKRGDPHMRRHRSIAGAPEQCVDERHRGHSLFDHPQRGLPAQPR